LKEHFIDAFAIRFQAADFAALVYDYRNWGSSDGLSRDESNFFKQAKDYSDAIIFVRSLAPEIDPNRICVWGAGDSGGVVMPVGAFDLRVKAVVFRPACYMLHD
jgi:cephalosporin-C deacetylase-like acetyl esterase